MPCAHQEQSRGAATKRLLLVGKCSTTNQLYLKLFSMRSEAEIRGIYRALGDPVLLKKCLHGKTKNANESFNNMVWCRCPKRVFVGHRVFRIAVSDAVICFNEGCSGRFKVIQQLTGRDGSLCRKGLKSIDSRRVSKAEKKLLAPDAKKRRRKQREENTSENKGEEFYEAGMH